MQVTSNTVARVVASGLLGAALLGCGHSKQGGGEILAGPGSGTSSAGVTSGLTTDPAADGPDIDVLAPERGLHTTEARVTVEGVVTDLGRGVAEVHVAGGSVPFDPETGAFQAAVDLAPGLNTIVVEAWDDQGARRERHVSLLSGALAPEADPLPDAGRVRLTDTALDQLEPGIAQGIADQEAAIRQQVLSADVPDVELEAFDFGSVDVDVDAVPGGVRFVVDVQDVVLRMKASTRFLLVFNRSAEGDVTARSVRLETTATLGVQGGQPQVSVGAVTASASGFAVPDFAAGERRRVQQAFEQGFADAAQTQLQSALTQALGSTSTQGRLSRDVMGETLDVDWALNGLTCDADGVTARFAANARPGSASYGDLTGSFALGTEGADLVGGGAAGGPDVGLTVHQDMLNRALHAGWRAGLLDFVLDQAAMDRLFPSVPSQMDTTALTTSVPDLASVLPPGLPLVLDVEGLLPPVVRPRPTDPQLLDLDLGGLRVRMDVIHPTEGPVELLTAVYAARVPVGLAEQGGAVRLTGVGQPELHVDVEGFSLPGAEALLERITDTTGSQLFQGAFAQVQGVQVPAVGGMTLTGLSFSTHEDSLVVLGKATPAPGR